METTQSSSGRDNSQKKRVIRPPLTKRAYSSSPVAARPDIRSPGRAKKMTMGDRRASSLSPSIQHSKKSLMPFAQESASAPETLDPQHYLSTASNISSEPDRDLSLPQCMMIKMMRTLATKKREFIKLRKNIITQQNNLIELYASLRELETRVGVNTDENLGEVRILSVTSWPAHDLLMLVRDDVNISQHLDINSQIGPQVLQQLHAQLNPIPEEVLAIGAEIMARRIDLINLLRTKNRLERNSYIANMEWKTKNNGFDQETERLHRLVAGAAENLKAKISYSLKLAMIPWLDRDVLTKKIERLQKENSILQHKVEEIVKKEGDSKDSVSLPGDTCPNYQLLNDELTKERAAREALKEVVSTAESMLRVARARIATLERQLKETRTELENARRKHKELEQLYRHRETSYDARSKKLIEVSKTGELTIEALQRQRDALELRVKELREQTELAEKLAETREAEQRARAESLQAKVAEQDRKKAAAESRVMELENKVKDLEDTLISLRERSGRLVDMERRRCLEYVPSKEHEPSDKETEIWKELQVTRLSLSRAEEELRQSKADKDNFLNSLSKIAQEGQDTLQEKIAAELLDRERKIGKLQVIIDEQKENEKLMEQSMTQYENQLAALRLEVKRLRNYDCYSKELPYQDLQTELLDLHMQVQTLTRERTALVTAAASRALMLERHERAADLFSRVTRARRDLAALLDGRTEPPPFDDVARAEVSRSLSSVCETAADTWTALRAERARVLRLESAVLAQSLQLERESRVRTQLERRRAILEREVFRSQSSSVTEPTRAIIIKNPSLIRDFLWYR